MTLFEVLCAELKAFTLKHYLNLVLHYKHSV